MTAPQISWPVAPVSLQFCDDGILVFAASLELTNDRLEAIASTLSADEHARAERFVSKAVRQRFIAARGILRDILGRYGYRPAAEIEFAYSPVGKPFLADNSAPHFNLAHSRDLALIAVTRLAPVGVDVELLREVKDAEAVAERFFSPRESAALKLLPTEQRAAAFFNLWTRKEACVKATGEGVAKAISQVEVSFLPGEPARVISFRGDAGEAKKWHVWELEPAPGYIGALAAAVPQAALQLYCWEY
jgi:4'-phosphopantetheinyl transferase